MPDHHRVVIVGGGFGGVSAAQQLKTAPVQVTLIDRRNFHLFQPLLYQVATGWLSPAIVGRASAVADIGRFEFTGFFAWLAWLFVHLMHLVEFENKILVLIQWGWYYFSRNRAARLITGERPICEVADRNQRGSSMNREERATHPPIEE
jgi:NADH dehydrogenase FAD-containing subunit